MDVGRKWLETGKVANINLLEKIGGIKHIYYMNYVS